MKFMLHKIIVNELEGSSTFGKYYKFIMSIQIIIGAMLCKSWPKKNHIAFRLDMIESMSWMIFKTSGGVIPPSTRSGDIKIMMEMVKVSPSQVNRTSSGIILLHTVTM